VKIDVDVDGDGDGDELCYSVLNLISGLTILSATSVILSEHTDCCRYARLTGLESDITFSSCPISVFSRHVLGGGKFSLSKC